VRKAARRKGRGGGRAGPSKEGEAKESACPSVRRLYHVPKNGEMSAAERRLRQLKVRVKGMVRGETHVRKGVEQETTRRKREERRMLLRCFVVLTTMVKRLDGNQNPKYKRPRR